MKFMTPGQSDIESLFVAFQDPWAAASQPSPD